MRKQLRKALESESMVVAPFVYDGLQARLAEMVENVRSLAASIRIPLICDADTGYGAALNVIRTVHAYEDAGAAALHLEDQVWPKRCGFLDGKQVIPLEQMLPKLRAACGERRDPDLVIIGRTDALQPEGWDSVERRARAYMEAGVDLVFVDGIRTLEDLDLYVERLGDLPRLYNGQLLAAAEIEARGFKLMIHPATLGVVFAAARDAMRELKETGQIGEPGGLHGFGELVALLGVPEALETAQKYES